VPKSPTSRLDIPRYEDSEVAAFSASVNAISDAIDAKACIFLTGLFAARPAFGIAGRYYLATDGTKSGCTWGDLYLDSGTEWVGPTNAPTHAPLGTLMDYAVGSDPVDSDGVTRWLIADGRAISRATYAAFFAKVSAEKVGDESLLKVWGEGNGTTTFNIPNLTGRVAVQPGGSGVAALGSKGGEQTHTLTTPEMPSHTHANEVVYTDPGSHQGGDTRIMDDFVAHAFSTINTQPTGGGGAHNNMQPYLGLNKIIRVL
jgi:microcystin-dependent protein